MWHKSITKLIEGDNSIGELNLLFISERLKMDEVYLNNEIYYSSVIIYLSQIYSKFIRAEYTKISNFRQ